MVRLGQALTLRFALAALGLAVAAGVSACAPDAPKAQQVADNVIRSIAAGDRNGAVNAFDGTVRPSVTPSSFANASRLVRTFGSYHYTTEVAALPGERYDLEANFDRGSMLVQLKLAPSGRILALHMTPNFTDNGFRASRSP